MNCREIESALLSELDGRITGSERKGLEGHLAACAPCRARAQELRRLWGTLDEMPSVEPSSLFDARLRVRLAAEGQPLGWTEQIRAWLGAAATWPRLALTVVALVALTTWLTVRPPWRQSAPVTSQPSAAEVGSQPLAESEADFPVVKDLPVFENYDVISNFDALSALPPGQPLNHPVE